MNIIQLTGKTHAFEDHGFFKKYFKAPKLQKRIDLSKFAAKEVSIRPGSNIQSDHFPYHDHGTLKTKMNYASPVNLEQACKDLHEIYTQTGHGFGNDVKAITDSKIFTDNWILEYNPEKTKAYEVFTEIVMPGVLEESIKPTEGTSEITTSRMSGLEMGEALKTREGLRINSDTKLSSLRTSWPEFDETKIIELYNQIKKYEQLKMPHTKETMMIIEITQPHLEGSVTAKYFHPKKAIEFLQYNQL